MRETGVLNDPDVYVQLMIDEVRLVRLARDKSLQTEVKIMIIIPGPLNTMRGRFLRIQTDSSERTRKRTRGATIACFNLDQR